MKDFRDLKVWRKAHPLTLAVYRIPASFPREELYGLTTQLRRSSSSISANLAEGWGRNGDAELARFCSIAMGISQRVGLPSAAGPKEYDGLAQQTQEVKRMLGGLLGKLNAES